jgi:hypothetical protein
MGDPMPDFPTGAVKILETLRMLPVWMLAGLALVGYAILYLPGFGGINPTLFRTQYGVWIWIIAVSFSILAVARALDAVISALRLHRKMRESRRALRLIPLHHQCWWHLAKQQDHSFISQIRIDIEAANLLDQPVRIVKASLIRPKGDLVESDVSLPRAGSSYHSNRHPVPPHDTATAALHLMARGSLAPQGKPLRVTIGITDQFGDEYQLKGMSIRSTQPILPKQPWSERFASGLERLTGFGSPDKTELDEARQLSIEWNHGGSYEEVDLILNEEKRAYAACGRIRGGLGSLNVGLQSEPNLGWTVAGKVPSLLWDKNQAKPVDSPNLTRLIKLWDALEEPDKVNLERYLTSHLHRTSRFADIAYLIFLALHRMGRTVEALRAARSHLEGDKVYGYSNLLGALAAVVSREHFAIDPALYPRIQKALEGDTEHNFGLTEKINLARLQHLDSQLSELKPDTKDKTDVMASDGPGDSKS